MPIIQWDDSYSVGVMRIDEEHKKLFEMVNKAYDATATGGDQEILRELVNDMREYALMHFATETALMKEYGYPEDQAHLDEHKSFIRRVITANSCDKSGMCGPDAIKLFQFLSGWLHDHIPGTDRALGRFLKERGVK